MVTRLSILLESPCCFCGYNGPGYYQPKTHEIHCPWYFIGGLEERMKGLISMARKGLLQVPCPSEPSENSSRKNTDDYESGRRTAYTELLRTCLRELGQEDAQYSGRALALERMEAVCTLRRICADHGDNDWEPNLHLSDIIKNHLVRYLEKEII